MKSDLEISQEAKLKPITEIGKLLGLQENEILPYGPWKAKVSLDCLGRLKQKPLGKYILVTSVNPSPLGEGKTVNTIGLSMALNRIGKKSIVCIRQPSMGPVFGTKGGAAGGGYSQVVPMEDVNLHLTGDIHAVGAANNLLAAFIDNSIFHGNRLNIDLDTVSWRRAIDMNDRALRKIRVGLGRSQVERDTGFNITAASEVMGIVALCSDLQDLRLRLGKILVAQDGEGKGVTADDLQCAGAMAVLLKQAVMPTLLQTLENTACFIHAGPFANISVGNSSVIADQIALRLSDYVVTEAGFGADMGAEKFFNIKCRSSGLKPDAAVIVVTVRAMKIHSGRFSVRPGRRLPKEIEKENPEAVAAGLGNLEKHIAIVRRHGVPTVVAINRMPGDSDAEIELIREKAIAFGAQGAQVSEVFSSGSTGGEPLAAAVVEAATDSIQINVQSIAMKNRIVNKSRQQVVRRAHGVDVPG